MLVGARCLVSKGVGGQLIVHFFFGWDKPDWHLMWPVEMFQIRHGVIRDLR